MLVLLLIQSYAAAESSLFGAACDRVYKPNPLFSRWKLPTIFEEEEPESNEKPDASKNETEEKELENSTITYEKSRKMNDAHKNRFSVEALKFPTFHSVDLMIKNKKFDQGLEYIEEHKRRNPVSYRRICSMLGFYNNDLYQKLVPIRSGKLTNGEIESKLSIFFGMFEDYLIRKEFDPLWFTPQEKFMDSDHLREYRSDVLLPINFMYLLDLKFLEPYFKFKMHVKTVLEPKSKLSESEKYTNEKKFNLTRLCNLYILQQFLIKAPELPVEKEFKNNLLIGCGKFYADYRNAYCEDKMRRVIDEGKYLVKQITIIYNKNLKRHV